jgi:hypothetical protein
MPGPVAVGRDGELALRGVGLVVGEGAVRIESGAAVVADVARDVGVPDYRLADEELLHLISRNLGSIPQSWGSNRVAW